MAAIYGVYYVLKKRSMYISKTSPGTAMRAIFRGIKDNKIGKQAKKNA